MIRRPTPPFKLDPKILAMIKSIPDPPSRLSPTRKAELRATQQRIRQVTMRVWKDNRELVAWPIRHLGDTDNETGLDLGYYDAWNGKTIAPQIEMTPEMLQGIELALEFGEQWEWRVG